MAKTPPSCTMRFQDGSIFSSAAHVQLLLTEVLCGEHASPAVVEHVGNIFASNRDYLYELVRIVACAGQAHGTPRERLRHAWAATNLIVSGPSRLRAAVLNDVPLLCMVADTFQSAPFDAARASLAADVLHAALVDAPGAACTATAERPGFVAALIKHVDKAPAADILARMVGTRQFGDLDAGAVVPAHGRSLVALARHRVHDALAQRFRFEAKMAPSKCSHIAAAMAEISKRASPIEHYLAGTEACNTDVTFALKHNGVSARAYNESIDYLTLAASPLPLVEMLDSALRNTNSNDALVSAFELLARCLRCEVDKRSSAICLKPELDYETLENLLLERMPALLDVLNICGARAADVLFEGIAKLLVVCSDATFQVLLTEHYVVDVLLLALTRRPAASVLRSHLSSAICDALQYMRRALSLLQGTCILQLLGTNAASAQAEALIGMPEVLVAVAGVADNTSIMTSLQATEARLLKCVNEIHAVVILQAQKARTCGLFRNTLTRRSAVKGYRKVEASEDDGKILFARSACAFGIGISTGLADSVDQVLSGVVKRKSQHKQPT